MAPEIVPVSLYIPTDVPGAQAALAERRDRPYCEDFPILCPANPQPAEAYGTFLAAPSWAGGVIVACIDTTAIDGRLFALVLPERLNRASLLSHIHLRDVPDLQITVAGVPFPLEGLAHFHHGDTVTVRFGFRPPAPLLSLGGMLSSPEGWQPQPELPVGPLDTHILVLTDGMHRLQTVDNYHRDAFKRELLLALRYSAQRTSLRPASPRVTDCSYRGFFCHSVIVATEAVCRLPIPPARLRPVQLVVLLDKRPVLRGFTWFLCEGEHFDLRGLQATLQQEAPPGHRADITGGHRFLQDGRTRVMARSGQVLQVRFVPLRPLRRSPQASNADDLDDSSDDGDDAQDPGTSEEHAEVEDSTSTSPGRRSRSPRPDGPRGPPPPQPVHRCLAFAAATVVDKWSYSSPTDVLAANSCSFTSVPLGDLQTYLLCVCGLLFGGLLITAALHASGPQTLLCLLIVSCARHQPPRPLARVTCSCMLLALPARGVMLPMVTLSTGQQSGQPPFWCRAVDPMTPGLMPQDINCEQSRRLPTPCRNLAGLTLQSPAPADPEPLDLSARLYTLLEDCARQPDFSGFLEAAAVLETLLEHCHGVYNHTLCAANRAPGFSTALRRGNAQDAAAHEPIRMATAPRLALSVAVPPTDFQQLVDDLRQLLPGPRPLKTTQSLHEDWLDGDLVPLIADDHVPSTWRRAFSQIPCWHKCSDPGDPWKLEIYTDGSAQWDQSRQGLSPAAWAFSAWLYTQRGCFLLGFAAHTLVPPETPYWIGELADTPLVAELAALCWAQVWALEFGVHYQVPILFCYDATSAGAGTFGATRCASVPRPTTAESDEPAFPASSISEFACLLRQCLVQCAHVEHHHVRGHSGCLANELVDQLSKQARRVQEGFYDRNLPVWPSGLAVHALRHWAWMVFQRDPHLPVLSALQAEAARLQKLPVTVRPPEMGISQVRQPRQMQAYDLAFASYNVLTMFASDAPPGRKKRHADRGMLISGKRDLLKKQFLHLGLWAIGLQETRFTTDEVMPDSDFIMLCTAADDQGSYGCALWINLGVSIVAGQPAVKVRRDQIVVTSFSPRHIQAQVDAGRLRLTILVAHGPRSRAADATEAVAFWQARQAEVAKRPEGSELVVLTDSNAHVGSVHTEAVGPHDGEEENSAGAAFHSDEHWWPRQIKAANRHFAACLGTWAKNRVHEAPARVIPPPDCAAADLPFVCRWCHASFRLRKHLAAHAAKSHGILCPARHFTPTPVCQACLRMYHSVERACYHVKRSRECLMRLAHLMPPMTLTQIRTAEAQETQLRKRLKKGHWQDFVATAPAQVTYGPRLPTRADVLLGVPEDDITLDLLQRTYRPAPAVLTWLHEYLDAASHEGPRTSTASFWLLVPAVTPQGSASAPSVSPF